MKDARDDLYQLAALLAEVDRVLNPLPRGEVGEFSIEPTLPPPLPSPSGPGEAPDEWSGRNARGGKATATLSGSGFRDDMAGGGRSPRRDWPKTAFPGAAPAGPDVPGLPVRSGVGTMSDAGAREHAEFRLSAEARRAVEARPGAEALGEGEAPRDMEDRHRAAARRGPRAWTGGELLPVDGARPGGSAATPHPVHARLPPPARVDTRLEATGTAQAAIAGGSISGVPTAGATGGTGLQAPAPRFARSSHGGQLSRPEVNRAAAPGGDPHAAQATGGRREASPTRDAQADALQYRGGAEPVRLPPPGRMPRITAPGPTGGYGTGRSPVAAGEGPMGARLPGSTAPGGAAGSAPDDRAAHVRGLERPAPPPRVSARLPAAAGGGYPPPRAGSLASAAPPPRPGPSAPGQSLHRPELPPTGPRARPLAPHGRPAPRTPLARHPDGLPPGRSRPDGLLSDSAEASAKQADMAPSETVALEPVDDRSMERGLRRFVQVRGQWIDVADPQALQRAEVELQRRFLDRARWRLR